MKFLVCLVFGCLLFIATPAFALFNLSELPPVGDCGFPADGHVAYQITYTLNSDCPTDGDVHVTNGVTVTIYSNDYCFKIRIEDGQVTVIDKDGSSSTYTSGTINNCSSGQQQTWTLPPDCFQRLGAIGIICRVHGPGPTIEVRGVTPEDTWVLLLRLSQLQLDAAQPGSLVASSAEGRLAVRLDASRNVNISMGPDVEGKVFHVTLEFSLAGRVTGTVVSYGGPPGIPAPDVPAPVELVAPVTVTAPVAPVAAAPGKAGKAMVFSGKRVPANVIRQPDRADGSLIHVVQRGDTLFSIARVYSVRLQELITRNQLEPGGDWIYSGQALVVRDVPPPEVIVRDAAPARTDRDDGCGPDVYVVRPGDTLNSIASAFGLSPRHLYVRNQQPAGGGWLHPGLELVIPDLTAVTVEECAAEGPLQHTVHSGHTLYSIALVYDVRLQDLIERNQLAEDGHWLYTGQVLTLRDAPAVVDGAALAG